MNLFALPEGWGDETAEDHGSQNASNGLPENSDDNIADSACGKEVEELNFSKRDLRLGD